MQLLTLEQVLTLHKRVIEQSGGATGIRNQDERHYHNIKET